MAVFLEQGDRRFRAHPLHSRDVVGAVAGEGLEIHHLLRRHPEAGDHRFAVDLDRPAALGIGATAHVQHGDVALVVHQLEQIPIPRQDAHPPAGVGGPVGQGAEHVVGLIARRHAQGDVQVLPQDLLQVVQIGEELFGRLVAVGLVAGVGLVAEGGFGGVEGDHHPLGAEPLAVLQ